MQLGPERASARPGGCRLAHALCAALNGGNAAMTHDEQIAQVEKEIADLTARLPKHSVPAAMLIELEDLQEKLEALKAQTAHGPE
jgi:hypothetical protein